MISILSPLVRSDERLLHLPSEASRENGGEHQVVGGEKAPVKEVRVSLGVRCDIRLVGVGVTCL